MKKILIIAGGLQIGGAERVAANISKYAPEGEFEFHYLVFEGNENVYGPEIEQRGGKVFTIPSPDCGYHAYIRSLGKLMDEHQYTAVHSHTMFNSGINFAVAKAHGIPCRIAHSHTTRTETKVSAIQKVYEFAMRRLILHTATDLFACGVEAGRWLYGNRAFTKKGRVIRNGIDVDSFAWSEKNRARIRMQYGIEDAYVIGHSGSIIPLKNQKLLIECMPQIVAKKPNSVLMLLGDGEASQKEKLKALASELGVSDRVIFCGAVMNVNEYLSAFDVFAFPSLREGTPLALLEAQANGIPCVVSENVPDDAHLTDLIHTLPLNAVDRWVDTLCNVSRSHPAKYREIISELGYGTDRAYMPIYDIYNRKSTRQRAMLSLSFDDGRGDNTDVIDQVLLPMQIPVTLNITTGYVDGTCPPELRPSDKTAMAVEDVVRFGNESLIEIALHGDRHQNTTEDILTGREKLINWLNLDENYLFGFASPGSGLDVKEFQTTERRELRENLCYMRTSLRIERFGLLRTLCRKAGRVLHWPLFYRIAYADTKMRFRDGKIVYSVPVLKDISVKQVCALIDDCVQTGSSLTLMFHSVLDDTTCEDNWTWSSEKFRKLCAYIAHKRENGDLEVLTTAALFKKLV